jgi:hypothetical protein
MKIETNPIQDFLETSLPSQPDAVRTVSNSDADAAIRLNYAHLIDEAGQSPSTDRIDVQRALELLSSGQLESPENIRAAVENILKLGI